jgi:2-methylcitrate dehydratase PrpD
MSTPTDWSGTDARTLAGELARWATEAGWDTISHARQRAALDSIVDTLGVAVAGSTSDVTHITGAYVRSFCSRGGAEMIGSGSTMAPALATLVNATSAHALDYDDVHRIIHGHPSCVLVPALVAVGQDRELRGSDVLDGYVAGIGVMAGLSRLLGEFHYARGWHATSTLGAIGAAAGVARALHASAAQICRALAIAASLSSGIRANFGTMTKPLHAGAAARSGVDAALLGLAGLTASDVVVESPVGLVALFGDREALQSEPRAELAAQLVKCAESALDDIGVKRYPCCGGSHFGIDAALEVRAQLDGKTITSVQVTIPRGGRTALIHDDPNTGLEGKFSLPYTVATALAYDVPTLGRFTDEAVHDPEVRRIMEVLAINEAEDGTDTAGSLSHRYAHIRATTSDGRSAEAHVADHRGSPNSPLTPAEVDAKFCDCVASRLTDGVASEYLTACRALPALTSLRGLIGWPFGGR